DPRRPQRRVPPRAAALVGMDRGLGAARARRATDPGHRRPEPDPPPTTAQRHPARRLMVGQRPRARRAPDLPPYRPRARDAILATTGAAPLPPAPVTPSTPTSTTNRGASAGTMPTKLA